MNLEGICENLSCKAYNKRIIHLWGRRDFDFVYDQHKCVCPICDRFVDPIACAFARTWWKFSGTKIPGGGRWAEDVNSTWRYAGDAHHKFDETLSGSVG
ncbi:hypothetical protein BC938DRAFT_480742 [Jimgerdemannia flammicorona]|uniref:Uncharacterized protein n=1 Tax=Jimgerdemannia flammicorona TaxID=994334 RepID=A0A433QX64_9FUNG|nr:hypothetical protein BC938DRAFT_480742 [Jimgerdemannia flammicorona]